MHVLQYIQETLSGVALRDQNGEPWLRIIREGRPRDLQLNDTRSQQGIGFFYYEDEGEFPKTKDLKNAFQHLIGQSHLQVLHVQSGTRVAGSLERIEWDLGAGGEVVVVTADTLSVGEPQSCFFRHGGAHRLPPPTQLSISPPDVEAIQSELQTLLRLDADQVKLVMGFCVAALVPFDIAPVLHVVGPEGSGKGTLCKAIKSMIDPFSPCHTSLYGGMDAVREAVFHQRVLCFDNISAEVFSRRYSDLICQLSTGFGFRCRSRGGNEVQFYGTRPVILNGIDHVIENGDLASRTMTVDLPAFEGSGRLTDSDFSERLEGLRPRFVSLMVYLLQAVLANYREVQVPTTLRMLHVVKVMACCETLLGWASGAFQAALERSQQEAQQSRLSEVPIILGLEMLLEEGGQISGAPAQVYQQLEEGVPDSLRRSNGWPRGLTSLTRVLNREAVSLTRAGFDISITRSATARNITIARRAVTG